MAQTSIGWTDHVWNPTRGCSRVSPGCVNCYAERIAARFSGAISNPMGSIMKQEPATFAGFAIRTPNGAHWTGKVELIEDKLLDPLHWRKPRRVFVNSMSDLFHEALPDESIDRVFAVMALTPNITYQVLTKRAQRMRKWASGNAEINVHRQVQRLWGKIPVALWNDYQQYSARDRLMPLPNVWLGVSVEDQQREDERIPELLRTPAAKRFVSYEPALEEVDWGDYLGHLIGCDGEGYPCQICGALGKLDWGIIGGESGPGARPFCLDWLRTTIRDFRAAGVPLFVKQMGSRPVSTEPRDLLWFSKLDSKGENWGDWPAEFLEREFPK
jgi:protein gp37